MVILALVGPAIGQHPPPGLIPNPNPPPPPVDTSPRYRRYEPQRPNDNAVQDAQQRKQQQRAVNEAAGRRGGAGDSGECAIGSSAETCQTRRQKPNPLTKH
jgi:hypothetical protein